MSEKILLDPVDFDALHLSALAHGGVGGWRSFRAGQPWCVQGLAQWLDGVTPPENPDQISGAGLGDIGSRIRAMEPLIFANDNAVSSMSARIPFDEWVEKVNVDVAVPA